MADSSLLGKARPRLNLTAASQFSVEEPCCAAQRGGGVGAEPEVGKRSWGRLKQDREPYLGNFD